MSCKSLDDTKNNIENLQERVIALEKTQNLHVGKITVILIVIGTIVTTLLNHFLVIFEKWIYHVPKDLNIIKTYIYINEFTIFKIVKSQNKPKIKRKKKSWYQNLN